MLSLRIACLSLVQHRRRAALLGIAIAGVTALLVLLNGLAAGIRRSLVETATTLSTGHVNIGGFFKVTAGQSAPVVTRWRETLAIARAAIPELELANARGRGWAKIVSDSGSMQAGITGLDIADEPRLKQVLRVVDGDLDELAQPNTAVVFEGHLERLGVRVGDAITISAQTTRGIANTIDCRIVAIAKDAGLLSKWTVFVPNQTLRALYQLRDDATGAVQLMLKAGALDRLPQIAGRLRTALEGAGYRVMPPDPRAFWMKFESVNREEWTGQKLDVTTWEDEVSFMNWTLQLLSGLTFILLVILVAIIVTGIMNTMWIAIRERTREIGALRAIGMQRGGVLRMFVLESLLLGLGGTVGGALLGAAIAGLLNAAEIQVPITVQLFLMADRLYLAIVPGQLAQAVLLISGVTALAALYPALRAARLRPIEAMSHFG